MLASRGTCLGTMAWRDRLTRVPKVGTQRWWQSWELWLSSSVISEKWGRLSDLSGEGLCRPWSLRPWVLGGGGEGQERQRWARLLCFFCKGECWHLPDGVG